MTEPSEAAARRLLTDLEERLATHDLAQMADLFTGDVVLIGDAVENFDRDSTVDYLKLMAEMTPTVRWNWERVEVVASDPQLLCFVAAGAMSFYDGDGQPMGRRNHSG